MWYMGACSLARSSRPSPLCRAGYTNDAAVTESSSAQTSLAGCLYDVHQPSICRPKDPGNGGSTTIGFDWRCKSFCSHYLCCFCVPHTRGGVFTQSMVPVLSPKGECPVVTFSTPLAHSILSLPPAQPVDALPGSSFPTWSPNHRW
jgi:hypothetical protein